jgi:hypothetical protein
VRRWWQSLIRDVVSPLTGLGLEVHEAAIAASPRYLVVMAGLVLIGIPLDAAISALSKLPGSGAGPSSPATPPPSASSAGASDGG